MQKTAVVLAAGQGTRMKSALPKVLHKLAGKTLLDHILCRLKKVGIDRIIVILGHEAERVARDLSADVLIVCQKEQKGTGHALQQCLDLFSEQEDPVLVVCGDTPLLRTETLEELLRKHEQENNALTVLGAKLDDPTGYGRLLRAEDGNIIRIIEEKDAASEEKNISEINTGSYCFKECFLKKYLSKLENKNSQNEYYLTDMVKLAYEAGLRSGTMLLKDPSEGMGVNDRKQLAEAGKILFLRKNEELMLSGVTIVSPEQTYIDNDVEIGQDTIIYPETFLEGDTIIGKDCIIGKGCRIVDSKIGEATEIRDSTILESEIGNKCLIGPYAYLRPGTVLEEGVKIGDFVEIKKSRIGRGSKVPHLSYVGDANLGEGVNIGCGTITCNYDGKNKYPTIINDHAFIGSNTNLVAPVEIGENATIGAGSTITKDVPKDNLAVARGTQKNYARKNLGKQG